jgi:hypothetical protein
LIFHCAKNVRKRLGGLIFAFLGANKREMINEFKISGMVVMA